MGDGRGEVRYYADGKAVGAVDDALEIVDLVAADSPVSSAGREDPGDRLAAPPPAPTPEPKPLKDLPNEEFIEAVLAGQPVQYKDGDEWVDLRSRAYALRYILSAGKEVQFRVKPETEEVWLSLWDNGVIYYSSTKPTRITGNEKWWVRVTRERATLRIVDIHHERPR